MTHTTFPNEEVLLTMPNGEVLVRTDALHRLGKQFVAVTRDGFRTDYPYFDTVRTTCWDNPEWFTKKFIERASRIIKADKQEVR